MSDLFRANQPIGTAVSGRTQNGATRPAQDTGPIPTEPVRYRTPTDIMRDRRLRDAKKAEEEKQKQLQAEDVGRRQEADNSGLQAEPKSRRSASGRPDSQIAQGYNIGEGLTSNPSGSQRRQETISGNVPAQARPTSTQQPGHARISSNTQRNRTEALERLNVPATAKPAAQQPANIPPPQALTTATNTGRAAFPHAFERWETLSSHWEGLTSYWIRRLQENTNELSGKPIDQQMSRQITDLSAAGANLFHAVVELQRLRASSERKFQRWFFETRNEQEQSAERIAQLERQLETEREDRTLNSTSIEAVRAEKTRADELVREMRRELQISKEEARRAWEELGRREQEERDRTIALRSGEPTLIGGVQVVPMQGMSSRHGSSAQRPQTRDGSFGPGVGAPGPGVLGGQVQRPPSRSQTTTTSLDSPGEEDRQFTYRPGGTSPTSTDPFTETVPSNNPQQVLRHEPDTQFYSAPAQTSASSGAANAASRAAAASPRGRGQQPPTTNGHFYQQPDPQTTIHNPLPSTLPPPPQFQETGRARSNTGQSDMQSYITSTQGSSMGEEEYHINPDGSYTLDSQGRRIPYNQPIAQEYNSEDDDDEEMGEDEDDYAADIERERMYAQQYGTSPAARNQQPQYSSPQQAQPSRQGVGGVGNSMSAQQSSGNDFILQPNQQGIRSMIHDQVTSTPPIPSNQARPAQQMQQQQQQPQSNLQQQYDPSQSLSPTAGGQATGWEGITPRHRHPTRLSDIIEEQTARTSPSRASGSYAGGYFGSVAGTGMTGSNLSGSYYGGGNNGGQGGVGSAR